MYEHEYDIINNFSTMYCYIGGELRLCYYRNYDSDYFDDSMINMIVIMILVMTKIFLYFEGFLSATVLIWIA